MRTVHLEGQVVASRCTKSVPVRYFLRPFLILSISPFQLFVKNSEGEIVTFAPIRITTAHSLKVESNPDPESNQLILGHDYEIKLRIYNKEGMEIYPSPVSY